MRHAPAAAARVIFAPSVAAARQAVAGEYEQVLQPLVALPRRGHRRYRRAGPPVARRQPAVRGQPVVAREIGYVYGYGQLGCRLRPYAGHREQAPVRLVGGKQRRYLGGQRLYLSGVLRYPLREQPDGAVLAGDGVGYGLLDDSTDPASAATLARLQPRVSAPTACGDASDIDHGPPTAAMRRMNATEVHR